MRKLFIAAAMAAATATGCSTGSPAPAGHPAQHAAAGDEATVIATPNPCELVTTAEVGAAVHATVTAEGPEDHNGLPGQRTCTYSKQGTVSLVSVAVWPADAALFEKMKTQAGSVSDIGGLGEKAFGEQRVVWALQGGWMINVLISGFDVTGTETVVAIGKSAISRI